MECLLIFQLDKYNQRHKYQTHAPQTHPTSLPSGLIDHELIWPKSIQNDQALWGQKAIRCHSANSHKTLGRKARQAGVEVKVKVKAKVAQMVKVKASVHAKWQLSDKINKKAFLCQS